MQDDYIECPELAGKTYLRSASIGTPAMEPTSKSSLQMEPPFPAL